MKKSILIISFLIPILCHAATFVVTNNNPTGSGSLQEALRNALQNGSASTDYIVFDLPISQTTIIIKSPLIASANLVIDGTTQSTSPFGLSVARVRLQADGCVTGLVLIDLSNVEIYGLWFYGFNASSAGCTSSAISISNTSHFILGKPGKGNCFSSNHFSILNPGQSGGFSENLDITVQSNRFGMDTTALPDYTATQINFGAVKRFLFGGNNANEGNRVGNGIVNVGDPLAPSTSAGDTITFKNNAFAFDAFNGPLLSAVGINVAGNKSAGSAMDVIIAQNKIGKDDANNKICVANINGNILITNNYIGSLNTAVTPGDSASAIYLENCKKTDSICIRNNTINGYLNGINIKGTTQVTISGNALYCNQKGILYDKPELVPTVKFSVLTPGNILGSTVAFSIVEIFTSAVCNTYCENGQTLVATVLADNNGYFNFSGLTSGLVSATATSPQGATGEFSGPKFSWSNVVIKNAACGQNNGGISGINILHGNNWHWEDSLGNTIGTDSLLSGLAPGKYRFSLSDSLSNCPVTSPFFIISSLAKPTADSNFSITPTSCFKAAGKIVFNGYTSQGSRWLWQDSLYQTMQAGGNIFTGLATGKYFGKISIADDSTCYTQFGPFEVTNTPGPVLNTKQAQIKDSECRFSNGAISNITIENGTGNPFYRWEDSTGKAAGNRLLLTNQSAGKFRLKYKDESACDTLVSAYFTIAAKGEILMDSSQRVIEPTACSRATGAITKLKITGADYVEWFNTANNQVISKQADLLNVARGSYRLTASNQFNCRDTSTAVLVPQNVFKPITITVVNQQSAHCNLSNGFVKPAGFSADTAQYIFKWTDSFSNQETANATSLLNVNAGRYFLSATDTNGCTAKIYSTAVTQTGSPTFDYTSMQVQGDTCNLGLGKISSLAIKGGQKPYLWSWVKDDNSLPLSSDEQQILHLKKGGYVVMVKDAFNCSVTSKNILIGDFDKQWAAPIADNQQIQRNTSANIVIKNYQPGSYALFDTLPASLPLKIASGSYFVTPRVLYDKTFYLQYTLGNCVSSREPVVVKVFDKPMISLSNAFSPNGDGINDVWKMKVQGNVTIREWLVFNRYGQQVFSSKDASQAWDGKLRNIPVAVGTYYWLVSAVDGDGKEIKLNGSVTVLR